MGSESNKRIIKLPLESAAVQMPNTKYDLSPLIVYARSHNKRLSDLSPMELEQYQYYENVQHLTLWDIHHIQGQRCRLKIRIDEGKVLNAAIEHDDIANAPSFAIVEVNGKWKLMVAHIPYCPIEHWADVEKCVKEVNELWRERGEWYLQNYVQLH